MEELSNAVEIFKKDLNVFHNKVKVLGKNSVIRLIKALGEYPLESNISLIGDDEKKCFEIGTNLFNNKLSMFFMEGVKRGAEENGQIKKIPRNRRTQKKP